MRQVMSSQQVRASDNSSKNRRRIMTSALWTVQGLLAVLFLFAGSMKLVMPIEMMTAQMAVPLPGWFMQFIGVAEVTGAIGLILPSLLRIRPGLTVLASCGLVIVMIGATVVTLLGGEVAAALLPLVVGLLCASVAYGRRSFFTADPFLGRFRMH
jgi:uncharacterized membrane protein YphA (DoxX/SURF4 family)